MSQPTTESATTPEQRLKMSYEEFCAWVDEDTHAEWVDGEGIVVMPPTTIHQRIVGFLYNIMSLYARLFNLGEVLTAPFEMRARPDGPAREPDLLFVARDQLGRLTPERLVGPADLIVEVVSDSSLARDRADKFYEYQEAGVREYWIVDPRPGKERADFYHLLPTGRYQAALSDAAGQYQSLVLPGFWIRPEWLWQEQLPDPLGALVEIAPQALRDAIDGKR